MPNKIKFNLLGFSLIFNNCNKLKDQKKIRTTSVETKKDEKETAGIRKKVAAVRKANSLSLINFFEIKKITKDVKQQEITDIILITKILLPKIKHTSAIIQDNKGGLE